MLKKIFKILLIFFIGALGGVFANRIFLPFLIEKNLSQFYLEKNKPVYNIVEKKETFFIQENIALIKAIEKAEKAVIAIKTETIKKEILQGSGVILTSDGLAITIASLIPKEGKTEIFLEEKKIPFQVLKRDIDKNLILIKIEEKNLFSIGFADLEKTKLGERIFLIENTFEKNIPKKIINEGIVSYLDEKKIETNILEPDLLSLLGGPVFNIEANLLGLNISKKDKISIIPISLIKQFTGF